jgi:DNA-binding transcriptional LysR family regulator
LRRKLAAQVQQEIAATWRFTKKGKSAMVRPSGPLRVNNGDAMMPALIAGTGLGILPEFILREALAADRLERLCRIGRSHLALLTG